MPLTKNKGEGVPAMVSKNPMECGKRAPRLRRPQAPPPGGGTTLLTAFRLRRHALGCELSAEFLSLSLRRICSNLVQVELSLTGVEFSLDPLPDPMDRSNSDVARRGFCSGRFMRPSSSGAQRSPAPMPAQLQLVQQERRFYFIGRTKREQSSPS